MVEIEPTDDAKAIIEAAEPGTMFEFAAGVHAVDSIEPSDGQQFTGSPGAVLTGAVVLEGFEAAGDVWVIAGQTSERPPGGTCASGRSRCDRPEDLFLDGEPLLHVDGTEAVVPGTWHFDYEADEIHLGSDPGGAVVELSVALHAFTGEAGDVVIRGLIVEKFATPAQAGAIHARDGQAWLIEDCVTRLNHGAGVYAGPGTTVQGCELVDNGQHGVLGRGADVLVEDNLIARNNYAGFSSGWSAGGAKFVETTGLVVRGNRVEANVGPGLWTDVGAIDTTYEGNEIVDNTGAGILHEISYDALVSDNDITGNGSPELGWVWGAGIQLANVSNVEVRSNRLEGNVNGIIATKQDRGAEFEPCCLTIERNVLVDTGRSGVSQDVGDQGVYDAEIVFRGNEYSGDVVWGWMDEERSWAEWQDFGNDVDGSYR